MNIRQRITLLVAFTFVAIFSIGGYAIYQSRASAAEVNVVTTSVVPSALASADLVSQLKDVQLATMTLVAAPDATIAAQARNTLNASKAKLQAGIELQGREANDQTQRGLVEQTKESLANYFSAIDDTAAFKLAGQTTLAEANLAATVSQYLREMQSIVDTLRIEKTRTKDEAIAALNDNMSRTSTAISIVTVVTVLLLTVLGVLLYRRITGPISRMQAMMSEIAGSQDFSRRVPVDNDDEIGRSIVAFNAMIGKIQENAALLRQKTNDIETMLQNMPQGILTIAEGNVVHPEYSAYLETIFETGDIAGRNVIDLVFADTSLGADALAQVEAIGGACLGEDAMNFEFNAHLLIGEIEKRMPDGRVKILDLNWSPIINDESTIVRLLLCVRDVTELRQLAAEASAQKKELEMIGEILAVSQEKFFAFIDSATAMINDNERLIHAHPTQSADAIAHLFRNMHTIKGNARTYGLRGLTNLAHEAEQTYDELRSQKPGLVWDQASLLEELALVRDALAHYARINEVSLGRKGPGRRGNVERYLLVDRRQIEESLHRLESINTANVHELLSARDAVRKVLRLLGTERVTETLSGVFDALPALARDLGKLPPIVEITDNDYVLRNQASGLLKNVFMHLVRNAIDHGLETPDERQAVGKPAAGTIRLEMNVVADRLELSLADDGRGLALARIRRLAIARGLIAADEVLDDQALAAQIFQPGFSTADAVTDVSGRGVGMDAVLNFVKRESGSIAIRFLDQAETDEGKDFRRFAIVVSLPASLAVHIEESDRQAAALIPQPSTGNEVLRDAPTAADGQRARA